VIEPAFHADEKPVGAATQPLNSSTRRRAPSTISRSDIGIRGAASPTSTGCTSAPSNRGSTRAIAASASRTASVFAAVNDAT
jgi:hypothetical protein